MRVLLIISAIGAAVLLTALGIAGENAEPKTPPGDIEVTIEQIEGARLRVSYDLKKAARALVFDSIANRYRERRWSIEDPDFRLLRFEEEDRIVRIDGKKFTSVALIAAPAQIRLRKEYQPVVSYGEGGVLVFNGHFWPMTERKTRQNTTFTFIPLAGGEVVAFGERKPQLENWRSPMAHPAFVYMGPLAPLETSHVMALVDPTAPEWIRDEFDSLTPVVFDYLADAFGFAPKTKPNLFLAAPLGDDKGRLSYAGDALPAQFQITLVGGAWLESTDQTRGLFRRSTIHEAFHLWQAEGARPEDERTAAWIHEGGADAVAAEAMVALDYWDIGELSRFEYEMAAECAAGLEDGSLARAHERGDYRALYACGYVIAKATATAGDATATKFWADFMQAASARGGYSEPMFYDFVEEWTGDKEFVRALRYFVRTPLAQPDREIARLMDAAEALAPDRAR